MNKFVVCSKSSLALLALSAMLVCPAHAAHLRRVALVQTETFRVAGNTAIVVGTNRKAALGDIKAGDRVAIAYLEENGGKVARRISDGVPLKPKAENPEAKQTTPHHHAANPNLLHVHGIVQAVNTEAGTLTLSHRPR